MAGSQTVVLQVRRPLHKRTSLNDHWLGRFRLIRWAWSSPRRRLTSSAAPSTSPHPRRWALRGAAALPAPSYTGPSVRMGLGGCQVPNGVHSDGRGIRLRLRLFGVVVAVLLAALLARLWYLQVLASGRYTQLAAGNRVREVVVPAPRGLILDRAGRVLAGNRASWAVTVDSDDLGLGGGPRREQVLGRLARLLHLPRARIDERLRRYAGSPY